MDTIPWKDIFDPIEKWSRKRERNLIRICTGNAIKKSKYRKVSRTCFSMHSRLIIDNTCEISEWISKYENIWKCSSVEWSHFRDFGRVRSLNTVAHSDRTEGIAQSEEQRKKKSEQREERDRSEVRSGQQEVDGDTAASLQPPFICIRHNVIGYTCSTFGSRIYRVLQLTVALTLSWDEQETQKDLQNSPR